VNQTIRIEVTEAGHSGEAQRRATALVSALGFGTEDAGKVAIVASELAKNLVKHTSDGGEILLTPVERSAECGIEIVAVDGGPGIANLADALRGASPISGTPGTGLGAVSELAEIDVHSAAGEGTVVLARLWSGSRSPHDADAVRLGGVCVPYADAEACGDAWAAEQDGQRLRVVLADGLGHGEHAAAASAAAVRVFRDRPERSPTEHVEAMHDALRLTRGATIAVLEADLASGVVRYAGVGNIAAAIVSGEESRALVSNNGTVGHSLPRLQEFEYELPHGATLVLHSDGLGSRWRLDRYAGVGRRDPAVIAALLRRDFDRKSDDVTVVVARREGAQA
jgi:anti-sigma regulatory factor (Ser/Thr protein kinase)